MAKQSAAATSDAARSYSAAWAPLTTVLIWSGNTVVTKAAAGVISPGSISFYRWLIAFVILLAIVGRSAWRERAGATRFWPKLAVLGSLGMVVYQSLAYQAARTTTAVSMGVILALMPLLSILLASALASERIAPAKLTGGCISLMGLVYLTSQGHPAILVHGGVHMGDGLMLVAVLANALYSVLLRRWAIPLPLSHQLLWQIGFATILLFPVWLIGPISPITAANLPLILYAAIPTSLLAPACWMMGIQKMGAARAVLFMNLLPLVVAVLAYALLNERLHSYDAIGGGLALLGVAVGLSEAKAARR